MGATKRGKGTKIMAIADCHGLPVALWATSATPHETQLVEELLIQRSTSTLPKKLVGDRAYDSDPLDFTLAEQGIELIAPHRKRRVKPKTQDVSAAEKIQAPMESGEAICLASQFSAYRYTLRV